MKPSYEELELALAKTQSELVQGKAELVQGKAELAQVKAELVQVRDLLKKALEQIELLKEQLNKNSKNSSKPPSTDNKSNTPEKNKKKRKGRKGSNRPLYSRDQIDESVACTQKACPHCGSQSIETLSSNEILQQVELPEVRAVITEYILKKYHCHSCKANSTAGLPKGIPYSAFGPKMMALTATLTGVFHLAKREAIQLIKDLYDVDIGVGSVPNIEERIGNALDPVCERIHTFILSSNSSKYFDETSWRNAGKRHYAWIATSDNAAIYKIDRHRNKMAFQNLIKNKDLKELPFVSDRYAVYKGEKHQFCLAHLIRNFRAFAQRDGPDKSIGESIEKTLSKACLIHGKYREGKIDLRNRNSQLMKLKKKAEYFLVDGYANGSEALSGLCNRLLEDFDKLWTFTKIKGMEPTNNLAERDLRKLVIWRKKSYGTRSKRGKRFVEKITSVSQTLRKQGSNVLKFVQSAVETFYSKKEAPFINVSLGF